jgi:radical SAM superfamily enzyme YgiQ (UPF0313 family)
MKILLIAPASGKWRLVGRSRLFGGATFRFCMLSLLSVAAETPAGVEVEVVDEQIEDVPWGGAFDLVGITCMTALAPRAYEIARRFRARSVPVVLGGMHPSFVPDEALHHADAVCVGEAEGVWPEIVSDARAGRLAGVYRADAVHDLRGLALPPRHLLKSSAYGTVNAVQATRGCPNRCAFCAVSAFHAGRLRCRPVEEVAAEVAALPGRSFIFVDDSLTADPDYARDLFRALRPLERRWIAQSTLGVTDHPDVLRAAAESGCIGMFVGLETFSSVNLDSMDKGFHRVDQYRERIAMLHAHGITVQAGIVFGFDRDGPGVFRATLRMLDEVEVDMIQVSILTPLPGTRFFETRRARIRDTDWSHYDYHHPVLAHPRLLARELQAGHDWVIHEFYRPLRIARRLARMALRPGGIRSLHYAATINAAYYGRKVRWRIRGWDPGQSSNESTQSLQAREEVPMKVQVEDSTRDGLAPPHRRRGPAWRPTRAQRSCRP